MEASSMQHAISAGNIRRTEWPADMADHLNLYLGNGRFGACFDAYGLMHNGLGGQPRTSLSNTTLMHADHWHRGAWGLDYWLPLARLIWADGLPDAPQHYRQALVLHDGQLHTTLQWPGLRLEMTAGFHPERRDLLAIDVRYTASEPAMPALLLRPETELRVHYHPQPLVGSFEHLAFGGSGDGWASRVQIGTADSVLILRTLTDEGSLAFVQHADRKSVV